MGTRGMCVDRGKIAKHDPSRSVPWMKGGESSGVCLVCLVPLQCTSSRRPLSRVCYGSSLPPGLSLVPSTFVSMSSASRPYPSLFGHLNPSTNHYDHHAFARSPPQRRRLQEDCPCQPLEPTLIFSSSGPSRECPSSFPPLSREAIKTITPQHRRHLRVHGGVAPPRRSRHRYSAWR
ncbi:hypothetical protein THAOC_21584 [Thalassiosira oceanica]|uniref:Uncharacterized protein n=1 Tax=Thalassiosira oceanica TaxID=159749 RepID=K0SIH5_THAOC|nr:hypothetical protein THAOC_21584 [Thalassiosira oceanica]|eukprot:EJK58302.1 hypothetical protein THAOC_21584 [Thalassiosira oceanica]